MSGPIAFRLTDDMAVLDLIFKAYVRPYRENKLTHNLRLTRERSGRFKVASFSQKTH